MELRRIRIGSFFGIKLMLDYTWFILLFLVAGWVTAGLLPTIYPRLTTAETVIAGLSITLFLFISVVLHEFAHAIYAKKKGLKIDRITLFIFGGAAELQEEPKTPRQEFLMAGIGPLTSIVLGLLFALVGLLGMLIGFFPLVAFGTILASINIMLALFNLIPGFPLDGGRIFRALVWKITNDAMKATKTASTIGKIFALMLITYGLTQLIFAGALGGLWISLIGYFLYQAAAHSYEQVLEQALLKDVRVSNIMSKEDVAVPGKTSVKNFLKNYVLKQKRLSLPVKPTKDDASGLVTAEDVAKASLDAPVEKLVRDKKITLHPDDSAMDAARIISSSGLREVPVVDNGKVVGILSMAHLQAYIFSKQRLTS